MTSSAYLGVKSLLEKLEQKVAPIAHKEVTQLASGGSHLPYRAILRKPFLAIGGFTSKVGYTDDWTLAEKLGRLPLAVTAKYYHRSPSTLYEIWQQARWIGRDQLKAGNAVRKIHTLVLTNPLSAVMTGIIQAKKYGNWRMIFFQMVYSTGIALSVLFSLGSKSTAR